MRQEAWTCPDCDVQQHGHCFRCEACGRRYGDLQRTDHIEKELKRIIRTSSPLPQKG